MDAFDEIAKLPKGQSAFAALGVAGLNALGGFFAGRLRGILAGFAPSTKYAGTLGILLVSAGIHYYAMRQKKWGQFFSMIAAGMAGFVGNDAYFLLRQLLGWGKWKAETAYKAGDFVLYGEKNDYYKAEKDIPATPTAEPGKDSRWVRFEMAQAITMTDVTQFAQALKSNDMLLDGIVKEQLLIFGPELAQQMGRELNQEEANNIYSGMRDSLKSVVIKFSEG